MLTYLQRFKDKEAASIKSTKFPKNFSEKVQFTFGISLINPAHEEIRSTCVKSTSRCFDHGSLRRLLS